MVPSSRALPDDAQERLVAGQLGEVQLLPDARRRVAEAPAGEGGTLGGLVAVGGQLLLAAQPGEAIDEEHAVDVERLVEADQPCLVAMYEWWFEPLKDKNGRAIPEVTLFTISFK